VEKCFRKRVRSSRSKCRLNDLKTPICPANALFQTAAPKFLKQPFSLLFCKRRHSRQGVSLWYMSFLSFMVSSVSMKFVCYHYISQIAYQVKGYFSWVIMKMQASGSKLADTFANWICIIIMSIRFCKWKWHIYVAWIKLWTLFNY